MHVHRRVGKGVTLALRPRGEQDRRHRGGLADGDGGDVRLDELHGVVDGEPGGDDAAGRVDVEADIALRVFPLEEEELGDDQVSRSGRRWACRGR